MLGYRVTRHGGPDVLEWGEIPDPEPRPGEVLVQVHACALNHLDIWLRNGVPGHTFPLPLIPGSEVAGTVATSGQAVTDLEPGERVLLAPAVSCGVCESCLSAQDMFCHRYGILGEQRNGGYAELISVPRRNVLPLPKRLSYVEAAALPLVFLTAWHMLVTRAQLQPLEDVLIHAAGSGVSSAAIQIARLRGARRIIATAGSAEKLAKAKELGATHVIDYSRENFAAETRRITGKRGVEVVVDHVGGSTFENSLRCLALGGRIVICGATTEHLAEINLRAVFFKGISILGSTMGSLAELKDLLRFVETGQLRPVVDRIFPLEAAPAAQRYLEERRQFGKVVLAVGDQEVAAT